MNKTRWKSHYAHGTLMQSVVLSRGSKLAGNELGFDGLNLLYGISFEGGP